MDIRIYLYSLIFLGGLFFKVLNDTYHIRKSRLYFTFFCCIFLGLESSLRNLDVGPDTLSYFWEFQDVKLTDWNDLFNRFYETYIYGTEKDPGFRVFIKIFQLFSSSWQLFLSIIAVFYFWALYNFLKNNTTEIGDTVFAFVLYVALFHIVGLSGIRQQIATGFSLFSLSFIVKKEHWKFIIATLIGSQFHISLLLMILLWFFSFIPSRYIKYLYFLPIIGLPFVSSGARDVLAFMAGFFENDYYMVYSESVGSEGSWFYVVLIYLVASLGLVNLKKPTISESARVYFIAIALMAFFAPLTLVDAGLIRIGQYFSLYMMIFVPYTVRILNVSSSLKSAILGFFILVLIFMSLQVPFEYYFYWQ